MTSRVHDLRFSACLLQRACLEGSNGPLEQELACIEAEKAGLERTAEQQVEAARMKEEELARLEAKRNEDLEHLTCATRLLALPPVTASFLLLCRSQRNASVSR